MSGDLLSMSSRSPRQGPVGKCTTSSRLPSISLMSYHQTSEPVDLSFLKTIRHGSLRFLQVLLHEVFFFCRTRLPRPRRSSFFCWVGTCAMISAASRAIFASSSGFTVSPYYPCGLLLPCIYTRASFLYQHFSGLLFRSCQMMSN